MARGPAAAVRARGRACRVCRVGTDLGVVTSIPGTAKEVVRRFIIFLCIPLEWRTVIAPATHERMIIAPRAAHGRERDADTPGRNS